MDLDVIVLKTLDRAPQYVARTPHGGIANGILKALLRLPFFFAFLLFSLLSSNEPRSSNIFHPNQAPVFRKLGVGKTYYGIFRKES